MMNASRTLLVSAVVAVALIGCGEKPAEAVKDANTTQAWAENMRKSAEKDVDELQKKPAKKTDWYK